MAKLFKSFGLLFCFWGVSAFSGFCFTQVSNDFEIERHYLDMENFLDWKAYQTPFSWKYEWDTARVGMLASVGSISLYEFYVFNEIRIAKDFGKWVSFQYEQLEDSFYRNAPISQEIAFRFGNRYGLSLIGFSPHDKKYGQIGHALSYGKRHTLNSVRLSALDHYSFYNERNVTSEKNTKEGHFRKTPTTNRLEVLWFWANRLYLKTDLRQTSETVYHQDDPEKQFKLRGNAYQFTLDWRAEKSWVLGTTAYHKEEFREQVPSTATEDLPDLEQIILLSWWDLYFHLRATEKNLITIGVLVSQFLNDIDSSYADQHYDCHLQTHQIYSRWQKTRNDWFHWLFSLQMGQATLFKDYEDSDDSVDDENLEVKAGLGVMLTEALNYRILVNTTWDLDFFETRQWDGGNVQLQMVF